MKMNFTKMHGLGNDYIYVYCPNKEPCDPYEISRIISRRHFSIGSDGLVLICQSQIADAKMRMFNADGSEGGMCGNAIRCVGKYLFDNGIIKKDKISIETLSGIKYLTLFFDSDGLMESVSVDMGKADFSPKAVPTVFEGEAVDRPLTVLEKEYHITALSTGSAHCVVFEKDVFSLDISEIGPAFESHKVFPQRVNTEFIETLNRREINMRVWEKGSGETLACGTGACASVAAAVKLGKCDSNVPVTVHLRGGDLEITCFSDYRIVMKGKAETVYSGVIDLNDELF